MKKSFKHYIAESVRTYNYTIKIAGEVDKNFLDLFKYNLKKFDPVEMSEPKSTPVQKSPYGFPGLSNQPITIIKAQFRYPATEPMIQQMAQMLGYNVNMVRVIDTKYDDSTDHEAEQFENQMEESPLLTHEQMADNGKEASKEYSRSYLDSIKKQAQDSKMDIPYDAKRTPDAFDPFKPYTDDKSKGIKSPMSHMTRVAKPKTGGIRG
jgi:hypothetical protein